MRARPCYAELRRRCKEEGTFAPCRHGSRRSASSRSSIRVRQRSSAAAAESCGAKAAAAVSDRAACSMNRHRPAACSIGCARFSRWRPRRVAASGEACSRSASEEAARSRKRSRRPSASAQSCHFARCMDMSGRIAIQGTRIASATMTPCIASLTSRRQAPIAPRMAAGSPRGSIRVTFAALARRGPRAAFEALEVRHEADRSTAGARRGKQHGGIAQAADLRQAEPPGRQRATDPVDDPVRVQRRRRLVTAVAGAGDQLHRPRLVARVEHGADAEKLFGRIIVKEARQQFRPQQRIQLVAEISLRTAPAVKLHTRYSPGTRLRPSADRTKPAA